MNSNPAEQPSARAGADSSPSEAEVSRKREKADSFFRRRPSMGVVLAGGLGLWAASAIGVGEVAVAMAAGYAAYRVLTRDRSDGGGKSQSEGDVESAA